MTVSGCNCPIWHSTVHVHAVLAGCTRCQKVTQERQRRREQRAIRAGDREGVVWAEPPRYSGAWWHQGWLPAAAEEQTGEEEGKIAGFSLIHTGSNEGLVQDCGKCAWKSYLGQNFEADPILWCGEKKGVGGGVREEREWRPRLQIGDKDWGENQSVYSLKRSMEISSL